MFQLFRNGKIIPFRNDNNHDDFVNAADLKRYACYYVQVYYFYFIAIYYCHIVDTIIV